MAEKTKELPARSTRGGRRYDALLGEEKELDDAFWGQGFFEEEAQDDDYQTESDVPDLYDEDFFNHESDADDTTKDEKETTPTKKRSSKKITTLRKSKWKALTISQKDMLQEAAITEVFNKASLQQHLQFEDEKRGKLRPKMARVNNDSVERRHETIEEGVRKVRMVMPQIPIFLPPQPKEFRVCHITGLEGRYRDPASGYYYHDAEAFKVLREQFFAGEERRLVERIEGLKKTLAQKQEKLKKI